MTAPRDEPVGSVADEAAKLFGALSDWAGHGAGDVADHLATGSAECSWCPVCRTLHAVRQVSPEVRSQLVTAASSFLTAAAAALTAVAEAPAPERSAREPRVQRIDLDADADADADGDADGDLA